MKNRIFRTLALGFGMTAIFATSGLNASVFYAAKVNIPFEFRVGKTVMQSGDYRVEQEFTKDIVFLVNMKTGHRIQMLRPQNSNKPSTIKFVFETRENGAVLKKLS